MLLWQALWDELLDVVLERLIHRLREVQCFTSQELHLISQPASAPENVIRKLGQSTRQPRSVRIQLRQQSLCLCGQLGEGHAVLGRPSRRTLLLRLQWR